MMSAAGNFNAGDGDLDATVGGNNDSIDYQVCHINCLLTTFGRRKGLAMRVLKGHQCRKMYRCLLCIGRNHIGCRISN